VPIAIFCARCKKRGEKGKIMRAILKTNGKTPGNIARKKKAGLFFFGWTEKFRRGKRKERGIRQLQPYGKGGKDREKGKKGGMSLFYGIRKERGKKEEKKLRCFATGS